MIDKRDDDAPEKDETLTFSDLRHKLQLLRIDPQMLCKNSPVLCGLVQHADIFGILENILDFLAPKKVLDVLGYACRNAAPFAETLPDLDTVGRGLLFAEKEVELINEVTCRLFLIAVHGHAVPYLVLYDQHSELFELFSEVLDVIADHALRNIDICSVVEHIKGAVDVELESRSYTARLMLTLGEQFIVKIFEDRHFLRNRIKKIPVIDSVDAPVNDCLLDRLQTVPVSEYQLTKGKDKVRLQGDRVIFLRIVLIDIHGVDELGTGR